MKRRTAALLATIALAVPTAATVAIVEAPAHAVVHTDVPSKNPTADKTITGW